MNENLPYFITEGNKAQRAKWLAQGHAVVSGDASTGREAALTTVPHLASCAPR